MVMMMRLSILKLRGNLSYQMTTNGGVATWMRGC